MCIRRDFDDSQESFDENLLELYKQFKECNEQEAGEKISDDVIMVDFSNYITENIARVVENKE
jgi:hypothetical protein